ncbi:MAG: phosphatidate cytidylyltransferase [Gammaproteobacteria bacterium]|nr:phosphatidate cytidylyltransferase [Gammaproteobacteria bacterium]MDH4313568.1 phosphatidate cytidylyltransferase [Gammaproteobacteria bacterium]MDH5212637.1 phosphatidate cytidylyltransferase [Gammaproteobacteria bacterium]MDH5501303.1 phosphatidate cytidylyltransferase [Gammaproteobacteria bacterium]
MLKQRIFTALVALVALAAILFLLPEYVARLIIAVLLLLAAWEWAGLLLLKAAWQRVAYVGLLLALGIAIFVYVPETLPATYFLGAALGWWLIAFVWLFFHPTAIPPFVGWLCGALVILPAWYSIDWLYLRGSDTLLVVLLIVFAADTGAYFAGKAFGRVKLAPAISPGKTWEGAIGGMAVASVVAILAAIHYGGRLSVYLPLFLAIALLSIVGDLTVSVFKRRAGVKDSGRLFPGHGGVLDRIDSVTAASPVFALAVALGAVT